MREERRREEDEKKSSADHPDGLACVAPYPPIGGYGSRDSHMSSRMACGTGRGKTADYSTCLLDAHEPGADGRRQRADGRRQAAGGRRPGPSASPARSSPRWGSPKGPLRDRSQCDAVWGDHPTGKARHRWSAVDLSANSLSNTSFFFCPLSPPVRSSFRRAVQPGSGAWPLTTDGPVQSSSVSAGGNHEEKIQGQPKGGRSGLPRPVPPVHAWELVRTAHVDELTASNSGCGAAGHDATASGIPVPARGTPHCDDRVFLSRPGHAGAVSECDVADCGRV